MAGSAIGVGDGDGVGCGLAAMVSTTKNNNTACPARSRSAHARAALVRNKRNDLGSLQGLAPFERFEFDKEGECFDGGAEALE